MINLCHIAPINYLGYTQINKVHLLLAHLVEENATYRSFYQQIDDYKILDNSAFEMYKRGEPMYKSDKLLTMAERIGANCIVMSDYPGQHSSTTINMAEKLAPQFKAEGYDTFFVPQSLIGDYEDYISAWEYAANSPDIDFIGCSILGAPNAIGDIEKNNKLQRFMSRWHVMNTLRDRGILDSIKRNGKKIHFLGAVDGWIGELKLVKEYHDCIYSWDSSQAIWHAILNTTFDGSPTGLMFGKNETEVNFDEPLPDEKYRQDVHENIMHNIRVMHMAQFIPNVVREIDRYQQFTTIMNNEVR